MYVLRSGSLAFVQLEVKGILEKGMPFDNVTASEVQRMREGLDDANVNETRVINYAIAISASAMQRYVRKRCEVVGFSSAEGAASMYGATTHDGDAININTEEIFPRPSLFLHPLPDKLSEYPTEPPQFLLDSEPLGQAQLRKVRETPGPSGCTEQPQPQCFQNTFWINGGAPDVMTVLQSECGLSIFSPNPKVRNHRRSYIMSPDATSCVIVACRVGLNPAFRCKVMSAMQHTAPDEVGSITRCCETFTAAMCHFDKSRGMEVQLYNALWEVALPAWFYAAASDESDEVLDSAERTISSLYRFGGLQNVDSDESAVPPLFLVEWFVVGGVYGSDDSTSILYTLFTAFFGSEEAGNCLLMPSFCLWDVLANSSHSTGRKLMTKPIQVAHRLREDGLCFWSFNTVPRPWHLGKEGVLYFCTISWGLLIDVGGGGCWPVAVKPQTRDYPLAALRHSLISASYRWTCPLRSEGLLTVSSGPLTDRVAAYLSVKAATDEGCCKAISLLEYVALFMRRRFEDDSDGGVVQGRCHCPILVRRCRWEKLNPSVTIRLLSDDNLLQFSTTPYCEPPDFSAIMRVSFDFRVKFGPEDVFSSDVSGILM